MSPKGWLLRGGCAMDERFMVKIPWGVFGPGGFWAPSQLVNLSETEQYRQNIAAGYNIAAECIPDQLGVALAAAWRNRYE